MLNIVKNILAWADKEPMPDDEWDVLYAENINRLKLQVEQRGFKLRSIDDIVNPPADIASRFGELTDFLISITDSLEYHPYILGHIITMSLSNKAIVKKQNLFHYLHERYLAVPPRDKMHNQDAGSVETGLANALVAHFTWDNFDKMRALIKNNSLGSSRILLLFAFTRFLHKDEVRQLLSELTEHPLLAYESKKLLKRKVRKTK